MSAKGITDELIPQEVVDDLRARNDLDDEDVRALGPRLAEAGGARRAENLEFAKHFTDERALRDAGAKRSTCRPE